MDKYNEIFELIQEQVDNGELTLEEAEALNDAAYSKYVEESSNEIETLEDAMTAIDNLLTAVESGGEEEGAEITEASVDEMRLRVYDAFEEGVISEDDKNTMLDLLNLENYE